MFLMALGEPELTREISDLRCLGLFSSRVTVLSWCPEEADGTGETGLLCGTRSIVSQGCGCLAKPLRGWGTDTLMRISSRLPARFNLSQHAEVVEQLRRSAIPVVDLTGSNPTLAVSNYPHGRIAGALGAVSDFSYDPDPFGLFAARQCIADTYRSRNVEVDPRRIALTASTSEAYSILFKLFCDPGDEVLVPTPSYPLFEHLAGFEYVVVRPYDLRYDGAWHIDFSSLDRLASETTRAVIVVNPNNPTGSFLKRDEASRLAHWARERKLPIISDEVFCDYRWSHSRDIVESFCGFSDAVSFSLNGLSKSAGMPQMKLGWMVVSGPPEEIDELRPRLELLLDTYLSVNWPVQMALPELLRTGEEIRGNLIKTAQTNLVCARELLTGSPVHLLTVEGGWTAILQLPKVRSEEDWIRGLMQERSILVQPGYFFDIATEPYAVVSLITPVETFRTGLAGLADYVQS